MGTFSPNQAILSTFRFFQKKKKIGGGGNFQNIFPTNFLAKSGNSKHFSFFSKKKKKIGGGGVKKFQNIFLINFLAKSGNSKHFSFFSFFSKKKLWSLFLPAIYENSGHFVSCHLHNSSGMCLHLAWTNVIKMLLKLRLGAPTVSRAPTLVSDRSTFSKPAGWSTTH